MESTGKVITTERVYSISNYNTLRITMTEVLPDDVTTDDINLFRLRQFLEAEKAYRKYTLLHQNINQVGLEEALEFLETTLETTNAKILNKEKES